MDKVNKIEKNNKPTVLVILDGWGIAPITNIGNPIIPKNAPNYFNWLKKYPNTKLSASGVDVGLTPEEFGNSEAGHHNIGAGRIVKQDKLFINEAISDGTFFKNNAFLQAINHAQKFKSKIHIMGLLTNSNSAHSSPKHLYALLELLQQKNISKIYLHLFTDGRDSGQYDALHFLKKLREKMNSKAQIATIMGRWYAMDRGKNWERTKEAYEAIVCGKSHRCLAESAEEAIAQAYNSGETDEFICPTVITHKEKPIAKFEDNDVMFFFNLRSDRARQLTKAFVQENFELQNGDENIFKRLVKLKNTCFVAMSDFGQDLTKVLTAFPSRDIKNSLPQVLCPLKQLYIAETEKYAHVTYFLNGGFARHFCGEIWQKIPSKKIDSYHKNPEMSAHQVTNELIKNLKQGKFNFACVNYANPDMVAHTGNLEATEKAIKIVDKEVDRLIKEVLKLNGQLIITADHGNAEELINLKTGEIDTEHSNNLVPFILISKKFKKVKLQQGRLADIAPTILKIMGLQKPKEMTGKTLF